MLARDVFLSSVPAKTKLSAEHCEKLWIDVEQKLDIQLEEAECTTRQQLEDIRAELDNDGQVDTMGCIRSILFNFSVVWFSKIAHN